VLLNGAGDIDAAHRLLLDAIAAYSAAGNPDPGNPGPGNPGGGTSRSALDLLLRVCAAGGRAELWAGFSRACALLRPDDGAELDRVARIQADPARATPGLLAQLDSAIAGLAGETSDGRVLALGAAA